MADRNLFARGSFLGLRTFVLVLLSLVLMFCNHRLHYFTKIQTGLNFVVAPIRSMVNFPVAVIDWADSYFTLQHSLIAENGRLRTQNLLLEAKVQRIIAIEKENSQLRALLSSSAKLDRKVLVAQLLAVTADPFDPQLILNKGSSDKVYIGQPVLDAYGVMGQVIAVTPTSSRVLLLTSTRSAVPVEDSRNGIRAIAAGNGYSGNLKLVYVPDTTDIKVGDLLVTSGLGLKFPQGYPVGVVSKVSHPVDEQFADITITPAAKLNRSRQVLLVWK